MTRMNVQVFDGPSLHSILPSVRLRLPVADIPILADPISLDEFSEASGLSMLPLRTELSSHSEINGGAPFACHAARAAAAVLYAARAPAERIEASLKVEQSGAVLTLTYDYLERATSVSCAQPIRHIIQAAQRNDPTGASKILAQVNQSVAARRGYAHEIHRAARLRRIEVTEVYPMREGILMLGSGERQRRIQATVTDRTSRLANEIASHKALASRFMTRFGLPVPRQGLADTAVHAEELAEAIGYPVVVKPATTDRGVAVTANVTNPEVLLRAFTVARTYGQVVIEKHIEGEDYRLTVFDGVMKVAFRRKPARVFGDGELTVRQLVKATNQRRAESRASGKSAYDLQIDDETDRLLLEQGLAFDSVPPVGRVVVLRSIANVSQGGIAEDVTSEVHPDNRIAAERAARAIGLDVAGVDFITTDIRRSHFETGGAICEINPHPAIIPIGDDNSALLDAYLDYLAPEGIDLSVPLFAVMGSSGSGVIDALQVILSEQFRRVGVASQRQVSIGGDVITRGPGDNRNGARLLLEDSATSAAIVEVSAASVAREGLGFDRCRCIAITDLHSDAASHEQSLQSAKLLMRLATTFAVLNYDHSALRHLAANATVPIWWVSTQALDEELTRHLANGGHATTLEQGEDGEPSVVFHGAGLGRSAGCGDRWSGGDTSPPNLTYMFARSVYLAHEASTCTQGPPRTKAQLPEEG